MPNQESLEIVRKAYDNFKAGDVPGLLGQLDSNVEWELPDIPGARISGQRHGLDGVRQFFSDLADDQEVISFEPREFVADGERVVALGNYEWRVRSTGKPFKSDFTHVFRVRDGKITGFHEFMDTHAVAEAYRE
jgi:ketosteroid isomerase-like protein